MFSSQSFAWGESGDDAIRQSDPMDLHSPDPYNLGRYVREIPVLIYLNKHAHLSADKMAIELDEALHLKATQWTGKKYGVLDSESDVNTLSETYLPIVSGGLDIAGQTDGSQMLPYFRAGNQPVYHYRTESTSGFSAVIARGPVPILQEFQHQKVGVNQNLIDKYDLLGSFEKTTPNTYGEEYIRLVGQGDKRLSSIHTNFDNTKNSNETYKKSNSLAPFYDKWEPKYDKDGNVTNREEAFAPLLSYYRGYNWSSKLGTSSNNKSTLQVPGQAVVIMENVDLIAAIVGEYNNLEPGSTANVRFKVTNYSQLPVEGTNIRWCINDGKYNWQSIEEGLNLESMETREFTVSVPVREIPYGVVIKVNQEEDAPAIETDYNNNSAVAMIIPKIPEPPPPAEAGPSTGNLILQAKGQGGTNVYGDYIAPAQRTAGTAKWTDMVTATLKPNTPTPPKPSGKIRNLRVTSWNITSAKLTYPKKNPNFTFGDPLPPQGTTVVNMSLNGHTATVTFEENWAMDGAKIYNPIRGYVMAETPRNYPITCQYGISFKYAWDSYEIVGYTEEGSPIYDWVPKSANASTSGNASANLLVNGSARNSLAN